MGRHQNGTAPLLTSGPPPKPQLSQDQQFEERRRIAKRLVRELRKADYSCGLGDDDHARASKRKH